MSQRLRRLNLHKSLFRHCANAADARTAVTFALSPGQSGDATNGRALLESLGAQNRPLYLVTSKAYEGNETRQLTLDLRFIPFIPSLSARVEPWEYDRETYERRNEVELLFRRLKGFRRIFSRLEKLGVMFVAFITFALIVEALLCSVLRGAAPVIDKSACAA
ncbi:transposase [Pandoraea horticolens]|uniref:transposase n=1 Tax=Pandoraea horticolens TaxID=2508298 RepID=UPI0031B638B8